MSTEPLDFPQEDFGEAARLFLVLNAIGKNFRGAFDSR